MTLFDPSNIFRWIGQKDMTFGHDFGYSFPVFSSLLKKRGKKKRRMNIKNRDQKTCLSARSFDDDKIYLQIWYNWFFLLFRSSRILYHFLSTNSQAQFNHFFFHNNQSEIIINEKFSIVNLFIIFFLAFCLYKNKVIYVYFYILILLTLQKKYNLIKRCFSPKKCNIILYNNSKVIMYRKKSLKRVLKDVRIQRIIRFGLKWQ